MKKWITAGVTVLGLALVLALTVLTLLQSGLLVKPANPNTEEPREIGATVSNEDISPEERAEALGAGDDAMLAYREEQEILKNNGTAILMPGASFRMAYSDGLVSNSYMYADVKYKGYRITKNRSDFQVEWDDGYAYKATFDRNGNVTNEYSYVVIEFDITCENGFSWMGSTTYFYPITYHSYLDPYSNIWNYAFGGELFAWNPLTANPEHPCKRNYESNRAYFLEAGVTYSVTFVFLMQDQYLYLPEEELILMNAGGGTGTSWDSVRKEKYTNPTSILSAEGETLATYTYNDPIRDEGWFPHRELS